MKIRSVALAALAATVLPTQPSLSQVVPPPFYDLVGPGAFMHRCPGSGEMIKVPETVEETYFLPSPYRQSGMNFDFRPVERYQVDALPVCHANGFIFFKAEFSKEELATLRPLVNSREFKALRAKSTHYRAAWLMERSFAVPRDIVNELILATWEASTPSDYHLYAEALLMQLPRAILVETDYRRKIKFRLIEGETFRRLHRFADATTRFTQFLAEFGDGDVASVIAHLQLDLIKQQNDTDQQMPEEPFRVLPGTPAWGSTHLPVIGASSRLGRIVARIPRECGCLWAAQSQSLIWLNPSDGTLNETSIVDGKQTIIRSLSKERSSGVLIAALPNGNILMHYVEDTSHSEPGKLVFSSEDHVVELAREPQNDYEIDHKNIYLGVNLIAFRWHLGSFDNKYFVLGWEFDHEKSKVGVYNAESRRVENLETPVQINVIYSMDETGPRFFMQYQNAHFGSGIEPPKKDGIVLWNYETRQPEFFHDCHEEDTLECDPSDALVDGRRKVLYVEYPEYKRTDSIQSSVVSAIDMKSDKALGKSSEDEVIPDYDQAMQRAAPFGRYFPRLYGTLSLAAESGVLVHHWGSTIDFLDAKDPSRIIERLKAQRDYRFDKAEFSPDGKYLEVVADGFTVIYAFSPS